MSAQDWVEIIAQHRAVLRSLAEIDSVGLFEYGSPRSGATEPELVEVERKLQHSLDDELREFLVCAGGWPAFHQGSDLFGPFEYLGGGRWSRAVELLGYLEDERVIDTRTVPPIGVSATEIDLFVIVRPGHSNAGRVIWYAGAQIEEYASFAPRGGEAAGVWVSPTGGMLDGATQERKYFCRRRGRGWGTKTMISPVKGFTPRRSLGWSVPTRSTWRSSSAPSWS